MSTTRTNSRGIPLLGLVALTLATAGCNPARRAAEQIAEKNATARGGLEAWRRVKTVSMSGTLEAGVPRDPLKLANTYVRARTPQNAESRRAALKEVESPPKQLELPFVMELKRPRDNRLEIRFQGDTAVQVYDGRNGWKLRPFLGRHEVEPFNDEELRQASQQGDLDGLLIDASAKGNTLELMGTEQVEGRDAYRIKVTTRAGSVRQVWVDTETNLEVRIDGTRTLDGKPRRVFTSFRDWRPEEGLLFAHTLETTVEGIVGSEKIKVERVTVNPELADSRFGKPR